MTVLCKIISVHDTLRTTELPEAVQLVRLAHVRKAFGIEMEYYWNALRSKIDELLQKENPTYWNLERVFDELSVIRNTAPRLFINGLTVDEKLAARLREFHIRRYGSVETAFTALFEFDNNIYKSPETVFVKFYIHDITYLIPLMWNGFAHKLGSIIREGETPLPDEIQNTLRDFISVDRMWEHLLFPHDVYRLMLESKLPEEHKPLEHKDKVAFPQVIRDIIVLCKTRAVLDFWGKYSEDFDQDIPLFEDPALFRHTQGNAALFWNESSLLHIHLRPGTLESIIYNLLKNGAEALRYLDTESGTAPKKIAVRVSDVRCRESSYLKVTVATNSTADLGSIIGRALRLITGEKTQSEFEQSFGPALTHKLKSYYQNPELAFYESGLIDKALSEKIYTYIRYKEYLSSSNRVTEHYQTGKKNLKRWLGRYLKDNHQRESIISHVTSRLDSAYRHKDVIANLNPRILERIMTIEDAYAILQALRFSGKETDNFRSGIGQYMIQMMSVNGGDGMAVSTGIYPDNPYGFDKGFQTTVLLHVSGPRVTYQELNDLV